MQEPEKPTQAAPPKITNSSRIPLLFVLTYASVWITGYFSADPGFGSAAVQAWLFSNSMIMILGAHELGHYFVARHYGVPVTLPYFIPFPLLSPFGTLGAFISMKAMPGSRKALFDIAIAGPLMSFFLSIPVTLIGLHLSDVRMVTNYGSYLEYGDSLLFRLLIEIMVDIPAGYELFVHPMAFAGWAGFFVTALNLMPAGQLDGGHVAYAYFGDKSRYLSYFLFVAVTLFALFTGGYLVWSILLLLLGLRHPRVYTSEFSVPLDPRRKFLAIASMVMLALTFVPMPVRTVFPDAVREVLPESVPPSLPMMDI